jgi:4-carboxymuconolactone decarboxylase
MTKVPASRVALHADADGDEALAAIYDRVRGTVRQVPKLYQALANAPVLLDGWITFAWSLRQDAESNRALRELAILRVAQLTHSDYVWRSHWRLALAAAVDAAKLDALDRWADSGLFTGTERAVLRMTDELIIDATVGDDTWAALSAAADDREIVELVMTAAWYSCVARIASGLAIPPEDSHARVPGLAGPRRSGPARGQSA